MKNLKAMQPNQVEQEAWEQAKAKVEKDRKSGDLNRERVAMEAIKKSEVNEVSLEGIEWVKAYIKKHGFVMTKDIPKIIGQ